jgi:uncharacterized protein (TIGR03083 family)
MTAAGTTPKLIPARRPVLPRDVAMRLAATEYDRLLAVLRRLTPQQWEAVTDCPGWRVRDLAGHTLGMTELAASFPEQLRQTRAAGKAGGVFIDALTALQVDKHRGDTTDELVGRFAKVGPKAVKGRRRTPGFVRRRPLPQPQAVGGVDEMWTVGFMVDVILTRDTWMHRVDVTRAIGQPLQLTADHDGVLVADIVAEWAQRHGEPCSLTLTGPAGGTWTFGSGGPDITEDAVEFCRGLSGRGVAALGTEVPF